jgi:dTDP-4-dehydrorhamnose reductase
MRLVALGAGGQVGRELTALGVLGLDRSQADLGDPTVLEAVRPDVVINAAAYTAVDRAEAEPEAAFRANATGVGHLARWCAARGVGLVHVSTDYVFDGQKAGEYGEDDPTAPLGVYGASKLAGEVAIRESGARHAIVRTSWVVGRHGANFVKTIARISAERQEIRVVADQRGRPTPAADLAAALVRVAQTDFAAETLHFAGNPVCTWHDLASHVVGVLGRECRVIPIATAEYPTAARRPANSALDCGRWIARFGALPDWRAGVRAILEAR